MKIFINPGHAPNGNPDPGACNYITGLRESDVVDDISQLIMYYLQQANYEVVVYQDDDLQSICDKSNEYNSNLFISVHCNAAENRSAQGTETFAFSAGGEGEKLAKCIQSQIVSSLETVDRGVKFDNFHVLRETDCPAVLVELAFISNDDDEALLASEEKKDEFAKAIARGVTDYVGGM